MDTCLHGRCKLFDHLLRVFDSATTENAIKVLMKGFREYGIPDEILTDHGTQFVAAKSREKAKHRFKDFLAENGVRHIVAKINISAMERLRGSLARWSRSLACLSLLRSLLSGTIT